MSDVIRIVIDEDIPFIKGVLEPYAEVSYFKGGRIGREEVAQADALIIRTRTKCDSSLLSGSRVRYIVSATIGTDHVDVDYCRANGIVFENAAGCNAWGVVQYVLAAVFFLAEKKKIDLKGKTFGIIGAGNVGERLASACESLGFGVLRCDPFVKEMLEQNKVVGDGGEFSVDRSALLPDHYHSMEEVVSKADIVTIHVPLNDSTRTFFGGEMFALMKPGAIFINASRGEVIDENSLIVSRERLGGVVLDVWCNEPDINVDLLKITDIATPHIAGYSLEGKINATIISIRKISKFFAIEGLQDFKIVPPKISDDNFNDIFFLLKETFPIFEEDKKLRDNPFLFEKIRSSYAFRREIPGDVYKTLGKINSFKIC